MDINRIKEELKSDEKAIVAAFGLERLYNKYKYVIWAVAVVVAGYLIGSVVYGAWKDSKLQAANAALSRLFENPNDTKALTKLKENNLRLYELYTYAQAVKHKDETALSSLRKSQDKIISDGASYHRAVLKKEATDSVMYKDLALLESAYLALRKGDKQKAREKLAQIERNAPAAVAARLLEHATIKVGDEDK